MTVKRETGANTVIWDALSKTDPKHTKQFQRAGGFKGTAIKPQWMIQRLTEQFGPVGIGWGTAEPDYTLVPAGEELLVFCTVQCWHGSRDNTLYGVGGDKVLSKNRHGLSSDDEAFKKAFTDAVGNAFKFVGIGADIHLGQFDDSKYLAQLNEEFNGQREERGGQSDSTVSPRASNDVEYPFPAGPAKGITELKAMARNIWREIEGCGDNDMLTAFLDHKETRAIIEQLAALENPSHRQIWEGDGKDNPGIAGLINRKKTEFAQHIADLARA